MSCRTGCPTPGAHASWGECLRAANIRIGQVDATAQRKWDAEISLYKSARAQGIQPAGTTAAATRRALDASDRRGVAFDAGSLGGML